MAKANNWQTLSLRPVIGMLDTRSQPADLPPGAWRYKLNLQCTPEGQLRRRPMFRKLLPDLLYDEGGNPGEDATLYHNHDHHHQDATREPITFLYEHTRTDGTRLLFDGTETRLSVMDESTGYWTDLLTGMGNTGSRWRAASLGGYVLFCNGINAVYATPDGAPGPGTIATIPELVDIKVTAAKVIIEFQGIIVLMNVEVNAARYPEKIVWSDYLGPLTWNIADHPAPETVLCDFQDLDYGDEILAAATMMNAVYIYTRRSIWRMTISGDSDKVFDFTKVYTEPRNQKGCLAYPFSLVSTGSDHYYMSREAIYRYNPYMAAPEKQGEDGSMEWLHRASGVMFTNLDTKMDGTQCNAPSGEYRPLTNEIWWSWPSGDNNPVCDWTLVAQTQHKTCDLVDTGFTAFCNFRPESDTGDVCNENQLFIGASGTDYALKQIGDVFYREFLTDVVMGADPTEDIDLDNPAYSAVGYYSELRGMVPTGLHDRQKQIRRLLIDSKDAESTPVAYLHVWIGNSQNLQDPLIGPDDTPAACSILWQSHPTKELACPNSETVTNMKAQNLRPTDDKDWICYWTGTFLYVAIRIEDEDGDPPIGGDTYLNRIDFSVRAMA